jgi:hypothetical protein
MTNKERTADDMRCSKLKLQVSVWPQRLAFLGAEFLHPKAAVLNNYSLLHKCWAEEVLRLLVT